MNELRDIFTKYKAVVFFDTETCLLYTSDAADE